MYLVTGASGFIGKHLLDLLARRGKPIYCLVRPSSEQGFRDLIDERWPSARSQIAVLQGDIGLPHCGLSSITIDELGDMVKHVFHLAALYDMRAGLEESQAANVEGTRNACRLAEALGATLHYVSSIAIAGDYKGYFREDMFDEGQKHKHPYFLTKFLAEKVVREECQTPYRIYRPGVVIGSSVDGEADKIDGIYYAFKSIQQLRRLLPQWFPLVGFEGSKLHVVPVDYVARALDAIAHIEAIDGSCPRSSIASSTRDTASFPTHRRKAGKTTRSIRDPKPSRLHTFCTGSIGERAGRECPAWHRSPVL